MNKRIRALLAEQPVNTEVSVEGWVRTRRDSGSFSFIEVNDGSCLANIQVIAGSDLDNYQSEINSLPPVAVSN